MKKLFLLLPFIFAIQINSLFAELVTSEKFSYSIDFPEGFLLLDGTEDETSLLFKHQVLAVNAFIRVWPQSSFKDSKTASVETMKKLSAKIEDSSDFMWRGKTCTLSKFSMKNAAYNETQNGWSLATPLSDNSNILVIAGFAETSKSYDLEQMILSLLDSLMIDKGSFRESGAVTTFAYPKSKTKKIALKINGKTINTTIDESDTEASQFVIDREFSVFKIMSQTTLWKEAWQRFYRIIAKDSFGRLKKVSFDIYSNLFTDAMKEDSINPNAAIAQTLLYWVQNFEYSRASSSPNKADFVPLTGILKGSGSDCDSRSMLVSILLNSMNIDSIIFISNTYSHAILGVKLDGKQGQTIKADDKEYLVGETTAKNITLGLLDAKMQDRSKWIPVENY